MAQQHAKRPRVAVIGAGIFGINVAVDVADYADVVLYERRDDILKEGSFINQFRHHLGYHYPRSSETVKDIQESIVAFEERYQSALVRSTPTYYGIAKEGSQVSGEEFLAFCDSHGLPYETSRPPQGYFNEDLLSCVIKVPEASYHYETLRTLARSLLSERSEHIQCLFNEEVIDCQLVSQSKKSITSDGAAGQRTEEYDFVINATYAHLNNFTRWLGLAPYPIRVDLAEVLIVTFPGPLHSLTVMDGPFATIMPTGNPEEYTLYHARESILDRYTPDNGQVKPVSLEQTNRQKIYEESVRLFPFLTEAKIIASRVVHRGVLANHEHDDARVADIVIHGNGCWSVLSGKILSSVHTAKRIAEMVKNETQKAI